MNLRKGFIRNHSMRKHSDWKLYKDKKIQKKKFTVAT